MNSKRDYVNDIVIENAHIIFRNFKGAKGDYNPEGKRNFSVVIDDPEKAEKLKREGWNIKPLRKRDEDEEQQYQLPVAVSYEKYPPKIYLIEGNGMKILSEDNVGQLDYADIENVDLTINPYVWDDNGVYKVKAYVKTMRVTIEEDPFAAKYADKELRS